ncbi:unnamed protein product [Chrysoparadoxa australica]
MAANRESLLEQAVDLINQAKLEDKEEKQSLLAQVAEVCRRDSSLLVEVVPMMVDFQTDFLAPVRRYVLTFLKDVVKQHPEHSKTAVNVLLFLVNDSNPGVRKQVVLVSNNIFRPTLNYYATGGGNKDEWASFCRLKDAVIAQITASAEVSSIVLKFMETLVLSYVPGTGLGPSSARDGDKSIHRDLSLTHLFLRQGRLEAEGRQQAHTMAGWLKTGGPVGQRFEKKHYIVLVNALQNIATSKGSMYDELLPAIVEAMEKASGQTQGKGSRSGSQASIPPGLHDAASQLRSACVKLLRLAPGPSEMVQRLAHAVMRSGNDSQARAAVDSNSRIRGSIEAGKAPTKAAPSPKGERSKKKTVAVRARGKELAKGDLDLSACVMACYCAGPAAGNSSSSLALDASKDATLEAVLLALIAKNLPPPPPRHSRHKYGFGEPGASGEVSTEEKRRKRLRDQEEEGGESSGKRLELWFETSTEKGDVMPAVSGEGEQPRDEGEQKMDLLYPCDSPPSPSCKCSMQVEEPIEEEAPVEDPIEKGLVEACRAFTRILDAENGAIRAGKGKLHCKVVAKLARMLQEGIGMGSNGATGTGKLVLEIVTYLVGNFRRRFDTAEALLTELYPTPPHSTPSFASHCSLPRYYNSQFLMLLQLQLQPLPAGMFAVYDLVLMSLLRHLPPVACKSKAGQKLFTSIVVGVPRLPEEALTFVKDLVNKAEDGDEIQTGLLALRDLVLNRPAARGSCLKAILEFTTHHHLDVRTKTVRLTANMLWTKPKFQDDVEGFAKAALASIIPEARVPEAASAKAEEGDDTVKQEAHQPLQVSESQRRWQGKMCSRTYHRSLPFLKCHLPCPSFTGTWTSPPTSEEETRYRLSLYFALCIRNKELLTGLFDTYALAKPPSVVHQGIEAELAVLAGPAMAKHGAGTVIKLVEDAPEASEGLITRMLQIMVPIEVNKPPEELVQVKHNLLMLPTLSSAALALSKKRGKERGSHGLQYIIPVLAGFGRERVMDLFPELLLHAPKDMLEMAFDRVTLPLHSEVALFTPVELLILLHDFDYSSKNVPVRKLVDAVSACLDKRSLYGYRVLREALDTMTARSGEQKKDLPIMFMRTTLLAVQRFTELKAFVAQFILPRLVAQQVWTQPRVWDGFIRCAKVMGTDTGATSFIALVQLPAPQLKILLTQLKSLKEPLKKYASTLVKVDPGVKEVLGIN